MPKAQGGESTPPPAKGNPQTSALMAPAETPPPPNSMRLYRGEPKARNPNVEPERQGQYWTRSVDRARGFAGKDGDVYYVDVPLERMGELQSRASGTNFIIPRDLRDARQPVTPPSVKGKGKGDKTSMVEEEDGPYAIPRVRNSMMEGRRYASSSAYAGEGGEDNVLMRGRRYG